MSNPAMPNQGWTPLDLHAAQAYEDAHRFEKVSRLPEPPTDSAPPSTEQAQLSALWELQARVGDAHENHGRNDERTMKAREEFYDALRAAIERLRHAGAMLSNCAFNLAQRNPGEFIAQDIQALDRARKAWDEALKS